MKNLGPKLGLAAILSSFITFQAGAIPITGDISFTGTYSVDNPNLSLATSFTSFNFVSVQTGTTSGDYAGTDGTPVTFTSFIFDPPTASILPLWTFTYLGNTYSFDATSVTVPFKSVNLLAVEGVGMAHVFGRDDTAGIWNITANKAGVSFSFSSSAGAAESTLVPDRGNTLVLLGLGLTGFALLRRKIAC